MKKILLCIVFSACTFSGYTQNFTLLANDPTGDELSPLVADIHSLYYSINSLQDSIWFKVVVNTPVNPNGDAGLMLGLDTNEIITDGTTWNGNNNSMNYDLGFIIFQYATSPGYLGYLHYSAVSTPISIVVQRPNNFTFIIGARLSQIDLDASFNLLLGTGGPDILLTRDVYDEVPNSGYLTISLPTGINTDEPDMISVYPNPSTSELTVRSSEFGEKKIDLIEIYDILGQQVFSQQLKANNQQPITIAVPLWKQGVYFIRMKTGEKFITRKFEKQ